MLATFEQEFSRIATGLGLEREMSRVELFALLRAAFYAALCNIAFNGLAGCRGQIRPEKELNRIKLERTFMVAREQCYASAGWRALTPSQKASAVRIFLTVHVNEENFAA